MESTILKNKLHLLIDGVPKLMKRKISRKINDAYVTKDYYFNPFTNKYDLTFDQRPKILNAYDSKDTKTLTSFYRNFLNRKREQEQFRKNALPKAIAGTANKHEIVEAIHQLKELMRSYSDK